MLIEAVIGMAATLAGDNDIADRKRVARDSVEQFKSGGKTTGLPSLQTVLGEDVAKRLREWFGAGSDFPLTEAGDAEAFAAQYGIVFGLIIGAVVGSSRTAGSGYPIRSNN